MTLPDVNLPRHSLGNFERDNLLKIKTEAQLSNLIATRKNENGQELSL